MGLNGGSTPGQSSSMDSGHSMENKHEPQIGNFGQINKECVVI